jgi:dihydrodipicolinate reductase
MLGPGSRFLEKDTEQYHVCLAAPGIRRADERRYAASLLDAIVGGSASSRLFQEIREKRGMAYSVYSFGSQYEDSGLVGLYVGTREEHLKECLEIAAAELVDVAAGNLRPGELERAKENIKGRLLLSLESTSARMTRLGKALVTEIEITPIEETIARIEGVAEADVAGLAAELLSPGALSAAGIGPSEERFRAAVERINPAALLAGPAGCDAAVDFTRPDAVVANVGACLEAGVPVVIGTTGFDEAEVDALAQAAGLPCFHAPNFTVGAVLMMRFAAEAARLLPRAEIVELHAETKRDAPSGTAKATAAGMGTDPVVHSVRLPGLVAHHEVIFGGAAGETLTIRHDTTSRAVFVPGVLQALDALPTLPPGLTVGLEALL